MAPEGARLVALAALTVLFVSPRARADGQPSVWVIEPTAEEAGAAQTGAADVARAQALARNKQYVDALTLLEQVDRAHPAAVHDCNLSLAYLRAGALTRAQLLWDVGALRNGERPTWCTGDLPKQLATALRAAGFVPVTIDVAPLDAVVEVGGVDVRGVHVVWLAPGPYTIVARAPGLPDAAHAVTVTAPSVRVAITVAAPKAIEPVKPPSEQGHGPVDLDAVKPPTGPAGDDGAAPLPSEAPVLWPAYAAAGAGVVAIGVGAIFHAKALSAKDDGNDVYVGSPALSDAKSRFSTARDEAIAGYAVGAIAIGLGAWWFVDQRGHRHPHEHAPAVGVTAGAHGGAFTLTWGLP